MMKKKKQPLKNKFMGGGLPCHGRESEKRIANVFKADLTPASGALAGAKSDFILEGGEEYSFRGECKSTVNESISLKHAWLCKIADEALETSKQPVLTISFVDSQGAAKRHGDFVLISARLFNEVFGK